MDVKTQKEYSMDKKKYKERRRTKEKKDDIKQIIRTNKNEKQKPTNR